MNGYGQEAPLVTIGVPAFNNATTIGAAVRSILNQTYTNWELIILNDGSTDDSQSVLEQYKDSRIRIVSDNQNKGLPYRRNQAIQIGTGKYFACMDGDDISFPERIQKQVEYLEEHPDIDLLGTGLLVFDNDGNPVGKVHSAIDHEEICKKPWSRIMLSGATFMGKREWFLKNPYRNEMRIADDQELLLRTYYTNRFAAIGEPLYGYRVIDLSLKKILRARFFWTKAMLINAWPRAQYGFIIKSVLCQVMKAVVDSFAIGSGLNYRILRHRAIAIDTGLICQWRKIWHECNKGE